MKYPPKKPKVKPQHVLLRRGDEVATISSHITTFVSMLRSAELLQLQAAVDWRNGSQKGFYQDDVITKTLGDNVWDWYFKQPISLKEVEAQPHDCWYWESGYPLAAEARVPWNASDKVTIEILRKIVPPFLICHESIQTRADDLFQKYELNPAETIAISHRGTDKYREATIFPIEKYFPAIDSLLLDRPHLKIWTQPEEKEIFEKIHGRYPSSVMMTDFFMMTDRSKVLSERVNPKSGYEKGLDAVTMMIMFSMCNVLVKNSSNLSDMAAALSHGDVIVITNNQ